MGQFIVVFVLVFVVKDNKNNTLRGAQFPSYFPSTLELQTEGIKKQRTLVFW